MKNINSKKIFVVIFSMVLLISCDDYLDINDDPNNPTDAPISALMVNSTFETAQNTFRMGSITSNYVQHLASPNPGSASDTMEPSNFSGTWAALYRAMTDLNDMIIKAEETGANHYAGIGQILMALHLAMVVDAWGDVPYSEGLDFQTITPSYDDDEELYQEVFSLLDSGIANLSAPTDNSVGTDDFIYGGDSENWIKFGYMLKARYLNHLSSSSSAEVLSAIDNGFESNEDDAQVEYFEEQLNPWFIIARNNASLLLGGWISEQFIEALDGTTFGVSDPRLPLLVGTTEDGEFIGVENGAGRGDAPEQGARSTLIVGQYLTSPQSPILIATYAEQKFIEAEAAFTVDRTRSYEAYLEGIRAHMSKIGVAQGEINEYINSPQVSVGEENLTLDLIFKEKWVALFLHPEAWTDARRFDYQYENFTLPENLNPDLNGQFIRRLAYPDSETSRNGGNVPNVTLLDRIFWDE